MATQTAENTPSEILYLDPKLIEADDNVRHGLIASSVDRLADSITELAGVQQPVTVEPKVKGKYRLVSGFYRHAAVTQLNAAGAGLKLPAIVRAPADATMRLKMQVAENVARESMSPMDTAHAIKRLLDAGTSRSDVRKLFTRPAGTKGKGTQPASNAWLNIMLNLLKLPKAVQTKIHEGRVTPFAAYELGKVDPAKVDAVLAKAEAEVAGRLEAEDKDEARLLKAEQKAAIEAEKVVKAEAELATAKQDATNADELVKEKLAGFKAARVTAYDPTDAAAKKAWQESLNAAEKDYKASQKLAKEAKNKLAKLMGVVSAANDAKQAATEEHTEAAAKVEGGKGKAAAPVGPADVKKAAAALGGSAQKFTPLKADEVRQAFKDVAKARNPVVAAIGDACLKLVLGELTPKLFMDDVEGIISPAPTAAKGKK